MSEAATWSVRPARLDELEQIGRAAAAKFPPAFVEALALAPPFERRWDSWDDTSLMRGRDVVVAVRDGRAVAAGIMECAEDGLHLFGLLDVLRILPLGAASEEASNALIQHARHLFGQLGKAFFVYACDADVAQDAWPEDAVDLGLTHCTIMSTAELLPQFTEHAWELTMSSPD